MALVTTLMATPALALISPIYHRGMTRDEFLAEQATEDELAAMPTSILGEHDGSHLAEGEGSSNGHVESNGSREERVRD
jgi:hypothetical protein